MGQDLGVRQAQVEVVVEFDQGGIGWALEDEDVLGILEQEVEDLQEASPVAVDAGDLRFERASPVTVAEEEREQVGDEDDAAIGPEAGAFVRGCVDNRDRFLLGGSHGRA